METLYRLPRADERDAEPVPAIVTPTRRRKTEQALVSPDLLKQLSRPQEWRAIAVIAMQWALIAAAIAVSVWANSWFVTIPALAFIATRQHALLIMMHDAAHSLISHNRAVNDTISDLFCSFPFLVSTKRYRANHLMHHRNVNAADDPDLDDNVHPESLRALVLMLAQDLFCMSLLKALRRSRKFGVLAIFFMRQPGFAAERVLFAGFIAVFASAILYFDIWPQFMLYWALPFFSFLQVLLRLRGFSEHAGRMDGDFLTHARTIDVGPVERIVFAPCNVNRHLEHHLYPSVPAHNLEALSEALRENQEFARGAPRTCGYLASSLSVVRELYSAAAATPAARPN
jgi:fatty acid desaturase